MPIKVLNTDQRELLERIAGIVAGVALMIIIGLAGNNLEGVGYHESNLHSHRLSWHEGESEKMHTHTNIIASIYYIGETASPENDFVSNIPSSWDSDTVETFGGKDSANGRRDFRPKHNTFYFALPAAEFNESGLIPDAREKSPWAGEEVGPNESLFKGRWIEITRGDRVTYAQWHDVGPNEETDYDYVFGTSSPTNDFGLKAGIDLSPDAAMALGFDYKDGSARISWKFVDAEEVMDGPWKSYPPIDNKTRWL